MVEEAVIKAVWRPAKNWIGWHWFHVEGPIIRARGEISTNGKFVVFKHFDLTFVIDRELVQELEDATDLDY